MSIARRRILNQHNSVWLILVVICMCALVYKPAFFQYDNVNMIFRQAAALGILTLGHVFVICCGCVDLSLVSMMQMAIAIFMTVVRAGGEGMLGVGLLVSLVFIMLIGLVNGILVAVCNVQSFLSTLFTGVVLVGIRNVFSGSTPLGVPPAVLINTIKGNGIVSNCIYIFLVVGVIAYIILSRTVFGREVKMVGVNSTAAGFSGVKVQRIIILCYCISAFCALLAGIVATGYLGFADQTTIGDGMEMDSMVAAVLGGNLLSGGKASVGGAIGGVITMTLMLNVVVLFGLSVEYKYILKGVILLIVVLASTKFSKT